MSASQSSNVRETREGEDLHYTHIRCEQWATFFDLFSRQHVAVPVTVEVETPEIGAHELARQAPLIGITASSEHARDVNIELITSSAPDGHMSHTITQPTRVTLGPEHLDPRWLEIESETGEVVTVRWSEREGESSQSPPTP
jgi:hypothetical protein